jgi:hypothetical protein
MSTIPDEAVEAALNTFILDDEDRAAGVHWSHGLSGGLVDSTIAAMRAALSAAIPFLGVEAWAVAGESEGYIFDVVAGGDGVRDVAEWRAARRPSCTVVPVRVVKVEVPK